MVDTRTKQWAQRVERVIDRQNLEPDAETLRTSILDLMKTAYRDGLEDSVTNAERRQLATFLYMSRTGVDRDRLNSALKVVDMLIEKTQ